jgi:predicted TIM-barrel fold metal-dependent hydrolase
MSVRLWGEDPGALAALGAPPDELEALERDLVAGLDLPDAELWDAHAHLGRDADGHALGAEGLLADLDRFGFAGAVCFPANEPGEDGRFAGANRRVLEAAAASGGRLIPFCRLDPGRPWEEELAAAHAGGARGLKLHPIAQRFRPEDPACVALVRAATELGWPVLIHAGFGARPLAAPIGALLDGAPGARLILAHGARGDCRAVVERLGNRDDVMFDTSLAALPDLVGIRPERLCLGADRPYGEHATALQLVALAARVAGWDAAQLRGVLGGNLRRWLP